MFRVRFPNEVRITLHRGNETIEDRKFDANVLYNIVKVRNTEEGHIFIFDIKGKNWRGTYLHDDYVLFGQEEGDVRVNPSWDSVDFDVVKSVLGEKEHAPKETMSAIVENKETNEVLDNVYKTEETTDTGKKSGGVEKNLSNWKRNRSKKRKLS